MSSELLIVDSNERLKFWTSYTYTESFGRPTNSLTFATGDQLYVNEYYEKLRPGTQVRLVVDGFPQGTFYVDKRSRKPTRSGGSVLTITARDSLAPLCDSGVNPLYQFTSKSTLEDVYNKVLSTFPHIGFVSTSDLVRRSVATGNLDSKTRKALSPPSTNQQAIQGGTVQNQTSTLTQVVIAEYDPTKPVFLKSFDVNQLKPHFGEGCYEFLARLSKRFRLGLWADALGQTVIVDAPNFESGDLFEFKRDSFSSNFLELEVEDDITDLPSVIIAVGFGGGGNFKATKFKVAMVNELTGYDEGGSIRPEVQKIIDSHKAIRVLEPRKELKKYAQLFNTSVVRPCYLDDEESRTFGQLEGFVRYEMATRQAKAMTFKLKLQGHSLNGGPFVTNAMCSIDDKLTGISGRFWIKEKTFSKSRESTTTELTLIPPYLFQF